MNSKQKKCLSMLAGYIPEKMAERKVLMIFNLAWKYGNKNGFESVKEYFEEIMWIARQK